mmetsp:Transcript_34176/g.34833  ORF Transcript_34176/g.34833 Transcript_34176/m.34833 type:complete len:515 (+) Transcript_34176:108-1652(+)
MYWILSAVILICNNFALGTFVVNSNSRIRQDLHHYNHLESVHGEVGLCFTKFLEIAREDGNKQKQSIVIFAGRFNDEQEQHKIATRNIVKTLCKKWKPSTIAITIDPRRIDIQSRRGIRMRENLSVTPMDIQSLLSDGFIIPNETLVHLNSKMKGKRKNLKVSKQKGFIKSIRGTVANFYEDMREAVDSILAPSKEMAIMSDLRVHNDNKIIKEDVSALGGELPEATDIVIDIAHDLKSNILLADRDCSYNRQLVRKALEHTPEFEMKIAETDVHCIDLEDTVGSGRKEIELKKLLERLGEVGMAGKASLAMKTHLPEVYSVLVEERARYISDACAALTDPRIFMLTSQYLLPCLQQELLKKGYIIDSDLTHQVATELLEGRFVRAMPTHYGITESEMYNHSSYKESTDVIDNVRKEAENVMINRDLQRIINWIVSVSQTIIPWHRKKEDFLMTPDEEDDKLRKEHSVQSNGHDVFPQEEQEKLDEMYKKVSDYQEEHCWVYDDSLVGRKGHYD